MWSRNYRFCLECKSTDNPHMAKGLCKSCYLKKYRVDNKERFKKMIRIDYLLNRDLVLIAMKERRDRVNFGGNRIKVLERDEYRCVKCGSSDKLNVHHIDGCGRGVKEKNNDLLNLITVCKACHLKLHYRDLYSKRSFKPGSYLKKREQWSYKHDRCINCGTTSSRHIGRGLCSRCYTWYQRGKIKIWSKIKI